MPDDDCTRCGPVACRDQPASAVYPPACPMSRSELAATLAQARAATTGGETMQLAAAAARTEANP